MISPQNHPSPYDCFLLPQTVSKNLNLMQNAPVGLFQISINGYFNLANDEMKNILKTEGYDIYRVNIFDFLEDEQKEEFYHKIESPKIDERLVYNFIYKNENNSEYLLTLTPEFNNGEFNKKWSGATTCLPARRNSEKQALAKLDELKKDDEMIKEQLTHLCHEVRIPINTITGMSYLLAENMKEETKKQYLQPLFTSADYLEKLVNSILDFSKMEGGHMELNQENYSLPLVLSEIQEAFNTLLKDKPVEIVIENNIEQDSIYGDTLRLKQILSNLVNNACKFTTEGKIGIKATPLNHKSNSPMIRFEVWDTGIGISKDKLKTVFEEYKQADAKIASKYGGTGLGLSIVQSLVELHDGKIDIKSVEGEGTTFIIDLPYQTQEPQTIQTVENKIFLDQDLIRGKKVLVFEDDPMSKRLMENILESWECDFEIVNDVFINPLEIQAKQFDLIFMDINMPHKNGFELTTELRNAGVTTPIIALTGDTFQDKKDRAFEVGMDDYLAKPFSLPTLEKTVQKWIEKNK